MVNHRLLKTSPSIGRVGLYPRLFADCIKFMHVHIHWRQASFARWLTVLSYFERVMLYIQCRSRDSMPTGLSMPGNIYPAVVYGLASAGQSGAGHIGAWGFQTTNLLPFLHNRSELCTWISVDQESISPPCGTMLQQQFAQKQFNAIWYSTSSKNANLQYPSSLRQPLDTLLLQYYGVWQLYKSSAAAGLCIENRNEWLSMASL